MSHKLGPPVESVSILLEGLINSVKPNNSDPASLIYFNMILIKGDKLNRLIF